jgi:hypothetical protein
MEQTPDVAKDVAVIGDNAYVAGGVSGLLMIDVADPANPVLSGSIPTLDVARGVTGNGSYVFIADGAAGLWIAPAHCAVSGNIYTPPVAASLSASLSVGPNPAYGSVRMSFQLPRGTFARLTITDPTGRRVRLLRGDHMGDGKSHVTWDGRDDRGRRVASGLYLVRLDWEGCSAAGRVVFLR